VIIFESTLGKIYLLAGQKGLQKLSYTSFPETTGNKDIELKAVAQLREYFAGERKEFDIPLDLAGTEFQMKVWAALRGIEYGAVLAYADVASRINCAKAVRAVGTANGRNPVPIIIPCHRVIAKNGGIGGYTGGLDIKRKLLELEGVSL